MPDKHAHAPASDPEWNGKFSGQEILKIARLPDFLVARVQDMAGGVEAVYGVTMIPRISAIDPRTKSTM